MQCHRACYRAGYRESNNAVTERMANATEKQQRNNTATPERENGKRNRKTTERQNCHTRPERERERKGATQMDAHSIGLDPGLEMIMIKMVMMSMRNVVP